MGAKHGKHADTSKDVAFTKSKQVRFGAKFKGVFTKSKQVCLEEPLIEAEDTSQTAPIQLWVLRLLQWPALIFLKSREVETLIIVAVTMLWTALFHFLPNAKQQMTTWDYKDYIKRISILFFVFAIWLLTLFPGSKFPTILCQWLGMANIVEAMVLGFMDGDYVGAVALALLAPFVSEIYCDDAGLAQVHAGGHVLGLPFLPNPMAPVWFFRLYYVFFVAAYTFGRSWIEWNDWEFLMATCLVPLIGSELTNGAYGSPAQWFSVRMFALIFAIMLGSFQTSNYFTLQSAVLGKNSLKSLLERPALRNALQAATIVGLVTVCAIGDAIKH